MSYIAAIRETLALLPVKAPCCRKALIFGMLAVRGSEDGDTVVLTLNEAVVPLARSLIKSSFGRDVTVQKKRFGRGLSEVRFSSHIAREFLHTIDDKPLTDTLQKHCASCFTLMLRGIFLASGRITDPEKDYHLEFSVGDRSETVSAFLYEILGFEPKYTERKGEKLLYYKTNAAVSEVLMQIGCSGAAFGIINQVIENEYRSAAERRANCETGNIARAVGASMRQIEVLEELEKRNKLALLPPELYETARMRLENRDMSLTQLASLMSPPISKSGLNHRLSKIMELAKQMLL